MTDKMKPLADAWADEDEDVAFTKVSSDAETQAGAFGSHSYASVQIDIPPVNAKRMIEAGMRAVHDADLADDGRELRPHVTVLYGLTAATPDDVRWALSGIGPLRVTLGDLGRFTSAENYDVAFLNIESGGALPAMNEALRALPHVETQPTYHPHATLAYVRKGAPVDQAPLDEVSGDWFIATEVTLIDADGLECSIPLVGGA